MNEKSTQRLALVVVAEIERRLAQPGAVPPAARRIGALLGEIAGDIHHPGVRAGVKRLAASLTHDAGAPTAESTAAGLIS